MCSFPSRGISSKRRPICRLCEIKFWYDTCYANMTLLLLPLAERRPLKTTLDSIPTRRRADRAGTGGGDNNTMKIPSVSPPSSFPLRRMYVRYFFHRRIWPVHLQLARLSTVTALPATNRGETLVPFIPSILHVPRLSLTLANTDSDVF